MTYFRDASRFRYYKSDEYQNVFSKLTKGKFINDTFKGAFKIMRRRKENVRINRSSCPEVFCKKGFLENSANSQGKTCTRASF